MSADVLQNLALTEADTGGSPREQDRLLRRTFRAHSRTFSLASRFLPRAARLPTAAVYLYCRTVDEVADQRLYDVGPEQAMADLDRLAADLDRTLAGHPPDLLLWQRLAVTHERFGLDPRPFHEMLDGARWDVSGRPIRTDSDLLAYSEYVAGSVGAMMLPLLAPDARDQAGLVARARALGDAMQITNILRDVGEDRGLGRCYLPEETMQRFGVTLDDLDRGAVTPAYVALWEHLAGKAEALFEAADPGIRALPLRARAGIRSAARMYREILNEVRASGYDNLTRRGVVPFRRKLRLALQDDYRRRRDRLARRRDENA
jgi:phytoene synthase